MQQHTLMHTHNATLWRSTATMQQRVHLPALLLGPCICPPARPSVCTLFMPSVICMHVACPRLTRVLYMRGHTLNAADDAIANEQLLLLHFSYMPGCASWACHKTSY